MNSFPPRHYSHYCQMQCEIRYAANQERIQNRAWHNVAGVLHFVADVTHVVVSEIVVNSDEGRAAPAEHKATAAGQCSGRKSEGLMRIEVGEAGYDHRYHCQHGADPEGESYFA